MNTKTNNFLIEKIEKGISDLEKTKLQYEEELKKYENVYGSKIKEQLQQEIKEKIEKELKQKQEEVKKLKPADEIKQKLENKQKEIEEKIEKFSREKLDYEKEIESLNRIIGADKEKRILQHKKNIEKIDNEISKLKSELYKNTEEITKLEKSIKEIYDKYKVKDEQNKDEKDNKEEVNDEQSKDEKDNKEEVNDEQSKDEKDNKEKVNDEQSKDEKDNKEEVNDEQSKDEKDNKEKVNDEQSKEKKGNKENLDKEDIKKTQPNELKVIYNRETNTYEMIDKSKSYRGTYYSQNVYLKPKDIKKTISDLEKRLGRKFKNDIASVIDCNLFHCLARYDRETGSHKSVDYLKQLEDLGNAKLDITYNLKGKRSLSIINDLRQKRIAKKSEQNIGAKIEKNENIIVKTIKNMFNRLKTLALPDPNMQLEDGKDINEKDINEKDINGKVIPSKEILEREAFSARIKVCNYTRPEISSYVNAYMTRDSQTEKRDITANNKEEYLKQLKEEGLDENSIKEIAQKITILENSSKIDKDLGRESGDD